MSQKITRAEVVAQIEARLAGKQTDAALAAWAFAQFYTIELADADEPPEDAVLAAALDDLLFADQADFAPSAADLQAIIARLIA